MLAVLVSVTFLLLSLCLVVLQEINLELISNFSSQYQYIVAQKGKEKKENYQMKNFAWSSSKFSEQN